MRVLAVEPCGPTRVSWKILATNRPTTGLDDKFVPVYRVRVKANLQQLVFAIDS